MASCKVTARKFQDIRIPLRTLKAIGQAGWVFDNYRADPDMGKMVSFVSLYYHEPNGLVYCGLTSYTGQVLITFDPESKEFRDLEYQNRDFYEPFDVKIHRSFEPDGEGNILFAIAGLHDLKSNPEAEGGRIFRLRPDTEEIEVLGRPVRHDYIQTIAYDKARKIVYGNCYPMGNSFGFDLKTSRTFPISEGVSAHKARCDNEGNLWGISTTHSRPIPHVGAEDLEIMREIFKTGTSIPLFYKFNPDDGYQFLQDGLPLISGGQQGIANSLDVGDGYMYVGTSSGRLYRVSKKTGRAQQIAENIGGRLEGIAHDPERGLLFLGGGTFYLTHVFVVDLEKRRVISDFWPVADETTGDRCIIVHALCATKRNGSYLVYLGETDNPNRSGHLWECEIKI